MIVVRLTREWQQVVACRMVWSWLYKYSNDGTETSCKSFWISKIRRLATPQKVDYSLKCVFVGQ